MPQTCSVCTHLNREAIELAVLAGGTLRNIAERFQVSVTALHRHKASHLPDRLLQAAKASDDAEALNVMAELKRIFARIQKMFDATDAWLTDPEDPERYTLAPRSQEVMVIYEEYNGNGNLVRKKDPMSKLLARIEKGGYDVTGWESKMADPRDLILKTAAQLESQLTLCAKLIGELDERPVLNFLVSTEYQNVRTTLMTALAPYADARIAVAQKLAAIQPHA